MLESIRLTNPKAKVILISSSSVYGNKKNFPLSENLILKPISPYALSKYLMERVAHQYSILFKIPIIIIRPFSIYGPRGRIDMLPFLIFKNYIKNKPLTIFGLNKNNRRDWTYIDDFTNAIFSLINNLNFKRFNIINIGYGMERISALMILSIILFLN